MSGIDAPDNRPALAWVLNLPKGWTTFAERCLLLALAVDSHDGHTCSPTREDVMGAAGMWASQYYPALKSLGEPNAERPALLSVEPHGRYRRNTYRFLRSPESATPEPDADRSPESATTDRSPESRTPGDSTAGVQARSPEQESRAGVQSRSPESATHTLPSPSRPEEGGGEEEGASAPAPEGADTTRLEADVFTVLGQRWPDETPVVSKRSRRLLAELLADGWTQAQIVAAVNTIGKKPRSPALLLEAHLTKLLNDSEPRDFGQVPTGDTTVTAASADPLAEENQTAVAKFLKWSGADRDALSTALTAIAAQGYTVRTALAVDGYSQVYIEHPDLGDDWEVYWEAFQGVEYREHVTHNEIRACFDVDGPPAGLTDAERMALWNLQQDNREDRGDIVCRRPTVAALREFVNVTGPIALAAYKRASQAQSKPATATPTPAPVAEVLAVDGREPGPDGFGTFDPPNRTKARPPGHDQAVREADQAERLRQAQALADADPQVAAALAALQNRSSTEESA